MHYKVKLYYLYLKIITLSVASILKTSFLINSYTRFFLNSGAIYNALTLSDNKTSIIPSTFLS